MGKTKVYIYIQPRPQKKKTQIRENQVSKGMKKPHGTVHASPYSFPSIPLYIADFVLMEMQ